MRAMLVAILILMAACQDASVPQDGPPPDATSANPCSLLLAQDVARITRANVRPARQITARSGERLCSFRTDGALGTVSLYLDRSGAAEFHERFDPNDVNTSTIEGLGDTAYLYANTDVAVLSGDAYLAVSSQLCCEPDVVEALAREALEEV